MKGGLLALLLLVPTGWAAVNDSGFTPSEPLPGAPQDGLHTITLTRRPNTPPGAGGTAQVEFRNGALTGLLVQTHGLNPGPYSLTLVTQPGGVAQPLGWIAATNPSLAPSREANDNTQQRSSAYHTELLSTQTQVELPGELVARSSSTLLVSDPGGNVVLLGELGKTGGK